MSETMGVLGPKGTHSEAAASYLNEQLPQRCELVTVPDLFACLQDVEEGRLDPVKGVGRSDEEHVGKIIPEIEIIVVE